MQVQPFPVFRGFLNCLCSLFTYKDQNDCLGLSFRIDLKCIYLFIFVVWARCMYVKRVYHGTCMETEDKLVKLLPQSAFMAVPGIDLKLPGFGKCWMSWNILLAQSVFFSYNSDLFVPVIFQEGLWLCWNSWIFTGQFSNFVWSVYRLSRTAVWECQLYWCFA